MSPPPAPLHTQACAGATQVLLAARALFAEHGVDGVSMQDIATRAGVSKANIFHHFASKEALYIAVLRDCAGQPSVPVADLIASAAPFEQRLRALMLGKIRDMLADESATRLVMRELSETSDERACHLVQEIFSEEIKARIAFFADAKARGELRPSIQPILADMLLGACCKFFFSHNRLCQNVGASVGHQPPATAEAFAEAVCAVLSQGMSADALPRTAAAPGSTRKPKSAVKPAAPAPARRNPAARLSSSRKAKP